ncbi:MAG: 4'-phosphopantetheinyl transferase superfamily protein [Gemmatimonadota bacterium]
MTPPTTFRTVAHPASVSRGLGESEIHVWKANLDASDAQLEAFARTLGPDEEERVGRLHAEPDRLRATASRGLLRHILAGYAGIPTADLRFSYGPAGKPELVGAADSQPLYFNTAHSGDLLLVAVGRAPSLGVDVERIRPVARWERVARRAFSGEEMQRIEALPEESRDEAFITCWTRKEACVKAVGEGVWSGFNRFEVSVEPREPAEIRSVDGEAAAGADWSLYHLEPAPGFVGALAVHGTGWRLRTGTLQSLEPEA